MKRQFYEGKTFKIAGGKGESPAKETEGCQYRMAYIMKADYSNMMTYEPIDQSQRYLCLRIIIKWVKPKGYSIQDDDCATLELLLFKQE